MRLNRIISCITAAALILSMAGIEASAKERKSPFAKISQAVASAKQNQAKEESKQPQEQQEDKKEEKPKENKEADKTKTEETKPEEPKEEPEEEETEEEEIDENYESPIDFEKYWKTNEDVYAYISIPGTEIAYPILQSSQGTSDSYYLKHTWDKKESKYGSIYTESAYNSKSFKDTATVIYGHRMNDGSMFGKLQELYSDESTFAKYDEIVIYLPEKELHYKVFAALPYGNEHILYNYDFSKLVDSESFFRTVFTAAGIGVNINEDNYSKGKSIVILSTCLKGNNKKRYLVLAQKTGK